MTPYNSYYGSKPDVSHLRELGYHAFILIQSKKRQKIYSRSVEAILVGYSQNSKAYQCYYPKTGRIIISRHVFFIEAKDNVPRPYCPSIETQNNEDECENGPDFLEPINNIVDQGGFISKAELPQEDNQQHDPDPGMNLNAENTQTDAIPLPRRLTRVPKLSAAGTAMKNVPYETHLERLKCTMHKNPQDAEINDFMGLTEDNPHTYKEAMQAYDASEWETSYDDELNSMKQHNV